MRYLIKAPYSGWHEVNEEQYYKYRKTLEECIIALKGKEKEDRINERTKIIND